MIGWYYALSAVVVAVWLPTVWRFLRAWRERRNPLSLAICASCCVTLWRTVSWDWVLRRSIAPELLAFVSTSVSLLLGVFFLVAYRWSQKRFSGNRRSESDA